VVPRARQQPAQQGVVAGVVAVFHPEHAGGGAGFGNALLDRAVAEVGVGGDRVVGVFLAFHLHQVLDLVLVELVAVQRLDALKVFRAGHPLAAAPSGAEPVGAGILFLDARVALPAAQEQRDAVMRAGEHHLGPHGLEPDDAVAAQAVDEKQPLAAEPLQLVDNRLQVPAQPVGEVVLAHLKVADRQRGQAHFLDAARHFEFQHIAGDYSKRTGRILLHAGHVWPGATPFQSEKSGRWAAGVGHHELQHRHPDRSGYAAGGSPFLAAFQATAASALAK